MSDRCDHLERRCPRLGSDVRFGYCRARGEGEDGCCWKILDCWWEIFDVEAHLGKTLSTGALHRLKTARPRPKVATLIDMIEQARQRASAEDP